MASLKPNSAVDYTRWSNFLNADQREILRRECEKYKLLCADCSGLLEDPIALKCQHLFCENCLKRDDSKCSVCDRGLEIVGKAPVVNAILCRLVREILQETFAEITDSELEDPELSGEDNSLPSRPFRSIDNAETRKKSTLFLLRKILAKLDENDLPESAGLMTYLPQYLQMQYKEMINGTNPTRAEKREVIVRMISEFE